MTMVGFLFGFRRIRPRSFADGWIPPLPYARNVLKKRLSQQRVLRRPGYDVFLPPSVEEFEPTDDDDDHYPGLVLYPGWRVNSTAYAPIVSKLSDEGIVVVVVAVPLDNFGSLRHPPVKEETARYLRIVYRLLVELEDFPVRSWAVGGHADGGNLAAKIALATSPGTTKLVLWGCGAQHKELSRTSALEVLVLNGSEDPLFLRQTGRKKHGCRTVSLTILGGNHNGFGHYESRSPEQDGQRTIPLDQQQAVVVDTTSLFLHERLRSPQTLVEERRLLEEQEP